MENGNTSIIENHLVDWHKGPFLLSYNTQYDYCMAEYHNSHEHVFNKEILYDLIEDFLQKRNSEKRWVPAGTLSGKAIRYEKCWGLDVYAFLKNHIMLAGEARCGLEVRGFYAVYEHKLLLKQIYSYLAATCPIETEVIQKCDESIKMSQVLVNLCVKFTISSNKNILLKMVEQLHDIEMNDVYILNKMLKICLK